MKNKNFLIMTAISLVIFSILVSVAAFYDLEISRAVADIKEGEYYSNNPFAKAIEIFGEIPLYLFLSYAFSVIFWNAYFFGAPWVKRILCVFGAIGVLITSIYVPFRVHEYFSELHGVEADITPISLILSSAVGLSLSALSFVGVLFTGKGRIKRQLSFAVIICFVAVTSQFLAQGMKLINKRVRFRAMNEAGDFSYYTPWYVFNGIPEEFKAFAESIGRSDSIRSFFSGHTTAAGITFSLLAVPYVFKKFNDTVGKIACAVIAFAYTLLVAYGRMVMGAHFFSDVIFGLAVSFFTALIGVWLVYGVKICKPLSEYTKEGERANDD